MNRRSLYVIVALCALIGIFFQINRMDGFLHFSTIKNTAVQDNINSAQPLAAQNKACDKYLIIYDADDVGAVLTRHLAEEILANQKKDYTVKAATAPIDIDENYTGVILISANPAAIPKISALLAYVKNGGALAVLERPNNDGISADLAAAMGIAGRGKTKNVAGLYVLDSFMVGARGASIGEDKEYTTDAMAAVVADSAAVHIAAADGTPLLWDNSYGKGNVIVYNGLARDDKNNMGIYAAMFSHLGSEGIYPVVGAKIFYIDDFPAPAPEGNFPRLYDELRVTTAEFYRSIWWPYMIENAARYDLKYTGLIIETYGEQVKPPFKPLGGRAARDNVIVYGRELLSIGGELGIHGYNHMSLAPAGYNQAELGYTPWESQADMEEAMAELNRYVKELYPDYKIYTYVPPSNILSPEGYAAVKKEFPELKVYASLWDGLPSDRCYYQDFGKNSDGTYNLPRVSAGYVPDSLMRWADICAINYIGIFSHFVHPDEIFYEESDGMTWQKMADGLRDFLADLNTRYGWLKSSTATEGMEGLADYLNLDYRVERANDKITIYSWGTKAAPLFILRSSKALDYAEGCTVTPIDDDAYLVEAADTTAVIYWREKN